MGAEVFGDKFVLEGEDELFLSGDNAYRYFRETRGLFTVFLAGIPGENHPLHHPKFQLDERILPYLSLIHILEGIPLWKIPGQHMFQMVMPFLQSLKTTLL